MAKPNGELATNATEAVKLIAKYFEDKLSDATRPALPQSNAEGTLLKNPITWSEVKAAANKLRNG